MKPIRSLTGLVAAAHTRFTLEGSLKLAVVEIQAAGLLADGVSRAFINGTTAECAALSLEERRALVQRWFEVARGCDEWLLAALAWGGKGAAGSTNNCRGTPPHE